MEIKYEDYKKYHLKDKLDFLENFGENISLFDFTSTNKKKLLINLIINIFTQETDSYIRKISLETICSLTISNIIRKGVATNILLEIDNNDDVFILCVAIKYLFYFNSEEEEEEITNKLISLCSNPSGEVSSEAYFRLGQMFFFRGNESNFLNNILESKNFFNKSYLEIENRLDAKLFALIANFVTDKTKRDIILDEIATVVLKLIAFDFNSKIEVLYLKIYEVIYIIKNITNSNPKDFFKNEFNELCCLHYDLINLELETKIHNNYLKILKINLKTNLIEPYYLINLKAEEARIRRLSMSSTESEKKFWEYLLKLLKSDSDNSKPNFDLKISLTELVKNKGGEVFIEEIDAINFDNTHEVLSYIEKTIASSSNSLITGSNIGDDIFKTVTKKLNDVLRGYPAQRFLEIKLVLEDIIRYVKRSTEAIRSDSLFSFLFDSKALEQDLQRSMINVLKIASKKADFYSEEIMEFADGGRVDIKYQTDQITIPIELKRTNKLINEDFIKKKYLSQAQTYTYNRDQIGFFIILDLSKKEKDSPMNNLRDLFGVARLQPHHNLKDEHPDYIIWAIVPGNKILPSERSVYT